MHMRALVRRALGALAGAMLLLGKTTAACAENKPHAENKPRTETAVQAENNDESFEKNRTVGGYVDVEAGAMSVAVNTLAVDEVNQSVAMTHSQGSGVMLGVDAGIRLSVVTLGARIRTVSFDASRLTTIGGELGVRFPIDRLELRATLGGGRASLDVDTSDPTQGRMPSDGFYAAFRVGLGVRITRILSIGGGVDYNVFALTPADASTGDLRSIASNLVAAKVGPAWDDARHLAGSGYGTALGFAADLGVQF